MSENTIIRRIVRFDETDSTNIRAAAAAENGEPSGTLFTADLQTAGKGRRGRSWVVEKGTSITMSLLLRPAFAADKASQMTLLAAMAITESVQKILHEVCGKDAPACQIKWPNDVLIGDKKICGILTEMHTCPDGSYYVIIGMGINVNTTKFAPQLTGRATSLKIATGKTFDRDRLTELFGESFLRFYRAFEKAGDLSEITADYDRMLVNRNRQVRIEGTQEKLTGTALGISSDGELLVRTQDGTVRAVRSGEVSVRGIYGYV